MANHVIAPLFTTKLVKPLCARYFQPRCEGLPWEAPRSCRIRGMPVGGAPQGMEATLNEGDSVINAHAGLDPRLSLR